MVLSGTVTDRRAAEAVGLNPDTAAYTKAKPRVQAYLQQHRAAMDEQRAQQETESQRRQTVTREQVLNRLWEIANLSPEATRNSATAQIKALSMIIAIEGLIPERRPAEKKSAFPPVTGTIYASAWRRQQPEGEAGVQPNSGLVPEEAEPVGTPPTPAQEAPPVVDLEPAPVEYVRAYPATFPVNPPWAPHKFMTSPDPSVPFSIKKNPFTRY